MRDARLLSACSVALWLVVGSPVSARSLDATCPGGDWREERHDAQMVICSRDDAGSHARELRATSEVNAPPSAVFDVVTDFQHYPSFMPYTKDVRVLSWRSVNVLVEYSRVSAPFVSDRDSVNEVRLTRGSARNGGVYRTDWFTRPDAMPELAGVVRVRLNTGSWVIEPIDGGTRSRVTYSILTDPGGSIPRFLTDRSNSAFVPALFHAVRLRATGHD